MAELRHVTTLRRQRFGSRLLVGRSAHCDLQVAATHVSKEHAALEWTDSGWLVRDLGSRNGTFVDSRRILPGEPATIDLGSKIAFGDPDELWELLDAAGPSLAAINTATRERVEAADLLALPNDARPVLTIYADPEGRWVVEDETGETNPISSGEMVKAGGAEYEIELPIPTDATPLFEGRALLEDVELVFDVPSNEESVQLTVLHRGRSTALEPREHGYLLLTLARRRLADKDLTPSERGWTEREDLGRMLRMDKNAMNVAIHRARKQLADAGVEGAVRIVEVERGRRRLGTDRFRIQKH